MNSRGQVRMLPLIIQGGIMESYAALAGFDWSSEKHDFALSIPSQNVSEIGTIKHSAESIREWVETTHRRSGGQIAICLEQSRGPLYYALAEYSCITLFPVNPATLARYRQAFCPSGAKDDPTDAELQRELVERLRDKLRVSERRDEVSAELDLYARYRRAAVEERTSVVQRLISYLKDYFPAFLAAFSDFTTDVPIDFLLQWPELQKAQAATDEELYGFFRSHSTRKVTAVARITTLRAAQPITTKRSIIEPLSMAVQGTCRQIKALNESIREFDKRLEQRVKAHPDADIFLSFPNMGKVNASRIISFFGTDRKRFSSADEVNTTSGVSPVLVRSGKTTVIKARVACNHFHRQSFVEWAGGTIPRCAWAKNYYASKRRKGADHHVAVRALAFKWIRVLYACWRNRTSYSEEFYLKKISSLA